MRTSDVTDYPLVSFTPYLREIERHPSYVAGLPRYPRNFSRDVFIAGILAMNSELLASQLEISAEHIGRKFDPATGEEPGKIHHEWPGVQINELPLLTTYNACDSTAFFLLAVEALTACDKKIGRRFLNQRRKEIDAAVEYLVRHLKDNLFYEFPPPGADRFALLVTYWKDSILPDAPAFQATRYPICYSLVHFQVSRAILAVAILINDRSLEQQSRTLFENGIRRFIRPEGFTVYEEPGHTLIQSSSDELHSLAYLPEEWLPRLPIENIRRRIQDLATSVGVACTPAKPAELLYDKYHGHVVWPFEQAFLHYASHKFGLTDLEHLTIRVLPFIQSGVEYFTVNPHVHAAGNDHQLWSVAAEAYFLSPSSLRHHHWL
ncbi:hypothetical protein KGQ71_03170 [Patescibacteria group bacterium]|nr:hypothetical protein [Patescibacteria group bacterium]